MGTHSLLPVLAVIEKAQRGGRAGDGAWGEARGVGFRLG
jgi:hypothetical protein